MRTVHGAIVPGRATEHRSGWQSDQTSPIGAIWQIIFRWGTTTTYTPCNAIRLESIISLLSNLGSILGMKMTAIAIVCDNIHICYQKIYTHTNVLPCAIGIYVACVCVCVYVNGGGRWKWKSPIKLQRYVRKTICNKRANVLYDDSCHLFILCGLYC